MRSRDYEPFNDEWKRYMMRLPKDVILKTFPEINPNEPRTKREIVALAAEIGKTRGAGLNE